MVHDVTQAPFSLSLLWRFQLANSCCSRSMSRESLVSKRVDALVHTQNEMWIVHCYCVEFFVCRTESKCTVCFRCEDNKRCPLGLSRFNDFQPEHLGNFILFKIVHFGSSSKSRRRDLLLIFRKYFHPIMGCLDSAQMAIPHGFEFQ